MSGHTTSSLHSRSRSSRKAAQQYTGAAASGADDGVGVVCGVGGVGAVCCIAVMYCATLYCVVLYGTVRYCTGLCCTAYRLIEPILLIVLIVLTVCYT